MDGQCFQHSMVMKGLEDQKERMDKIEVKIDRCYNLIVIAILTILGTSSLNFLGM